MKKILSSMLVLSLMTSCAIFSDPAFIAHATRVARAILVEYQPEARETALALHDAIEQMQEAIRRFAETGVIYKPTPDEYRLLIREQLEMQGLDAETINGILAIIFPPADEVTTAALADHRTYERHLRRIAKELDK